MSQSHRCNSCKSALRNQNSKNFGSMIYVITTATRISLTTADIPLKYSFLNYLTLFSCGYCILLWNSHFRVIAHQRKKYYYICFDSLFPSKYVVHRFDKCSYDIYGIVCMQPLDIFERIIMVQHGVYIHISLFY